MKNSTFDALLFFKNRNGGSCLKLWLVMTWQDLFYRIISKTNKIVLFQRRIIFFIRYKTVHTVKG